MPAEVRHHRRNRLKRSRDTVHWESKKGEYPEASLHRQQRLSHLGHTSEANIDPKTAPPPASIKAGDEISVHCKSPQAVPPSLHVNTTDWSCDDHKVKRAGAEDDECLSTSSSRRPSTLSPVNMDAQHLDEYELLPVEESITLERMQHLLPSSKDQDKLHKITA